MKHRHNSMKIARAQKNTAAVLAALIGLAALGGLLGCSGAEPKPYTRDGDTYGVVSGTFRHRWWNYYERGLSFAEGAFYTEAISDFQEAIDRRSRDQRMARTYGMHFIDYFPHRELGIVYLETDELQKARDHLERSIEQWPSAKARYYLDRLRRRLILRRDQPIAPPNIQVGPVRKEIWTRQDPVMLAGRIEDENYVAAVRIGDRDLFLESARKVVAFTERLDLSPGSHAISVYAENLGGRAAQVDLVFHVDRQGPLITLEKVSGTAAVPGAVIRLQGSVYDPAGVATLAVNGKKVNIAGGTEVFFDETIRPVEQSLRITALDMLGNRTATELPPRPGSTRADGPILLAANDLPHPPLAFFSATDDRAPEIELEGWQQTQVVFVETIYLEGRVSDASRIVRLSVNDTPVLRREGRMIAFGHLAHLSEGRNRFVVRAADEHGHQKVHAIEVIRKIPEVLKLEQRLSVTVVPFDQKGEISNFGLSFQDYLIDALVHRNRFRMIERSRLDAILREQQLGQTALVEKDTALQLGRLAAAHAIVTGTVVESRWGIEVIARMIDVETSEILDTEDVYSESRNPESMQTMARGLAVKFHRQFPLVDGLVLEKKGNLIFTDLGQEKIGCQKRLLIYRDHPIQHPVTGKMLGSDTEILSQARIRQVSAEVTKAELVEPPKQTVNVFDKVITQ